VRELARLRQLHIVPLIKETGRMHAKALETTDGGLAIDWQMEGAVLQLRANLSREPLTLPATSDRPIYGTPPDSGLYAQNTVVFAIA